MSTVRRHPPRQTDPVGRLGGCRRSDPIDVMDPPIYPTENQATGEQMRVLNTQFQEFHLRAWNCTIIPSGVTT